MQQEDYFMRQIDLLGRAIGKILSDALRLQSQGKVAEGVEAAIQSLKSELDLDIDELIRIPREDLVQRLKGKWNFTDESIEKLADLLSHIAEGMNQKNGSSDPCIQMMQVSFLLYEHCSKASKVYSFDRHQKMVKIRSRLDKDLADGL